MEISTKDDKMDFSARDDMFVYYRNPMGRASEGCHYLQFYQVFEDFAGGM